MSNPKVILIVHTVILLSSVGLAYTETSAVLDPLQEYAQQCDAAIGITVPGFNCDEEPKFTPVPTTGAMPPNLNFGTLGGTCDRPNVLNTLRPGGSACTIDRQCSSLLCVNGLCETGSDMPQPSSCDPGSHFWVIRDPNKPDAFAVAHCRKHAAPDDGVYRDIAVIQHNTKNGATCFYQALDTTLDGRKVKAPLEVGESSWIPEEPQSQSRWLSPAVTAGIGCVGCHDNGPIIRSPYLTQIRGNNQLPGVLGKDMLFNRDPEPYFFIGHEFASWKAFKVEVRDNSGTLNRCNGCHRMGVSNIGDGGTARDFGIRATAMTQLSKNPHSTTSPIWMINVDTLQLPPNQPLFSQDNFNAAAAIRDCALEFHGLPVAGVNCRITQYTPAIVDDFVSFDAIVPSHPIDEPIECPRESGFGAIFKFSGRLRQKVGSPPGRTLTDLLVSVRELTNQNLIVLPSGATGGVGAVFPVPNLSQSDIIDVPFSICMKQDKLQLIPFTFVVDVLGVVQ